MNMIKAYEIGDQQGLSSLRQVLREAPEPGPGQVLLRVRAVCLNHRDLKVLGGSYGPRRPDTRVPISDGVGEVLALGVGAQGVVPGDRVICPHFVHWPGGHYTPAVLAADLGVTLDGWLAEQIVVPAAALVRVPRALNDTQAAALGAAALTAWNAVVEVGRVQAGDRVLALGTGGVSIFALQLARLHGASVAITSSSDDKLQAARALGADITLNYSRQPDWAAELARCCGGADIVIETGGQATLADSIASAAPRARIVLIGALAGAQDTPLPNFLSIVGKNLSLHGITAGSRDMLQALVRAVELHSLQPVIGRRFAFDQAHEAYACLAAAGHMGKVLIDVSPAH